MADNLKDIQHTDLDRVGLPSCGERNALVAIFNAIGGENWTNNTNWLNDEPLRDWYGVIADATNRVVGLNLSDNGLAGEISADIGDLPNLERVSFFSNQLDGEIPAEFGGLSKLQ